MKKMKEAAKAGTKGKKEMKREEKKEMKREEKKGQQLPSQRGVSGKAAPTRSPKREAMDESDEGGDHTAGEGCVECVIDAPRRFLLQDVRFESKDLRRLCVKVRQLLEHPDSGDARRRTLKDLLRAEAAKESPSPDVSLKGARLEVKLVEGHAAPKWHAGAILGLQGTRWRIKLDACCGRCDSTRTRVKPEHACAAETGAGLRAESEPKRRRIRAEGGDHDGAGSGKGVAAGAAVATQEAAGAAVATQEAYPMEARKMRHQQMVAKKEEQATGEARQACENLVAMGFEDERENLRVLAACNNNLLQAVGQLVSRRPSSLAPQPQQQQVVRRDMLRDMRHQELQERGSGTAQSNREHKMQEHQAHKEHHEQKAASTVIDLCSSSHDEEASDDDCQVQVRGDNGDFQVFSPGAGGARGGGGRGVGGGVGGVKVTGDEIDAGRPELVMKDEDNDEENRVGAEEAQDVSDTEMREEAAVAAHRPYAAVRAFAEKLDVRDGDFEALQVRGVATSDDGGVEVPAQLALPPPTRCEVAHDDKIAASYAAYCGDGLPRQGNGEKEVIEPEVGEQYVEQDEVSAAEQTALEAHEEGAYGKRMQSEKSTEEEGETKEGEGETKEIAAQACQKHMALGNSGASSAGVPDVEGAGGWGRIGTEFLLRGTWWKGASAVEKRSWYPVRVVEYAAAHKIKFKAKSPSFCGQCISDMYVIYRCIYGIFTHTHTHTHTHTYTRVHIHTNIF